MPHNVPKRRILICIMVIFCDIRIYRHWKSVINIFTKWENAYAAIWKEKSRIKNCVYKMSSHRNKPGGKLIEMIALVSKEK